MTDTDADLDPWMRRHQGSVECGLSVWAQDRVVWRSAPGSAAQAVEVGWVPGRIAAACGVGLRHRGWWDGPALRFPAEEWALFAGGLRGGLFADLERGAGCGGDPAGSAGWEVFGDTVGSMILWALIIVGRDGEPAGVCAPFASAELAVRHGVTVGVDPAGCRAVRLTLAGAGVVL